MVFPLPLTSVVFTSSDEYQWHIQPHTLAQGSYPDHQILLIRDVSPSNTGLHDRSRLAGVDEKHWCIGCWMILCSVKNESLYYPKFNLQ